MKDIREFFKPLLWSMRLLGLIPFYYNENGYAYKFWLIIYSCFLYLIVIYGFIQTNSRNLKKILPLPKLKFNSLIDNVEIIVILACIFILPILNWIWSRKLSILFKNWSDIQISIFRMTKSEIHLSKVKSSKKLVLEIVLLILVLILDYIFFALNIQRIPEYGLVVIFHLISNFWIQYCNLVVATSKTLKHHLRISAIDTENFLFFWFNFCIEIKTMLSFFSILFFFTISTLTMLVLIHTYYLLKFLAIRNEFNNDFEHPVTTLIILALYFWYMYTICAAGDHLEKKITSSVIHTTIFGNVFKETTFSLLKTRKLQLTVKTTEPLNRICGFIKINKKLLISLISVVVSYSFVLIQFQIHSILKS